MSDHILPQQDTQPLEQAIGHQFRRHELLIQALIHRSFVHETRTTTFQSFERLEFLGDAVLELVVSHFLWDRFPDLSEGVLTQHRANLVNETTLARIARRFQLGNFLILGKGERASGGANRSSILSDSLEALVAAAYLDGGIGTARIVCRRLLNQDLQKLSPQELKDPKTHLQETAAARGLPPPQYRLLEERGPEHRLTFRMQVSLNPDYCVEGEGSSKKRAAQEAARQLLRQLSPPSPSEKEAPKQKTKDQKTKNQKKPHTKRKK